MLVFSPTPRQQGATRGGRSTRADSATTLGESRRAEKHRGGGGWVILHPRRGRWGGIRWGGIRGDWSAYHPPVFCLWTVLRATDTLALPSSLFHSSRFSVGRLSYCLSLSLSMIEIIFQSPNNPVVSARILQAIPQRCESVALWNIDWKCENFCRV